MAKEFNGYILTQSDLRGWEDIPIEKVTPKDIKNYNKHYKLAEFVAFRDKDGNYKILKDRHDYTNSKVEFEAKLLGLLRSP